MHFVAKSSWNWESLLVNLWLFGAGYLVMAIALIPILYIGKKYRWNQIWVCLVGGAVAGLVAPIPFWGLLAMGQFRHMTIATVVASALMMGLFWFSGIKRNPIFSSQPNQSLQPTQNPRG
jgi:hypothetical protein